MVGQIIYLPEFINYLDKLVFTLYKKEYFGFIESSQDFIDKIYDFIESNIFTIPNKHTTNQLRNLGNNYITYQSNQRTTWYILFDKNQNDITVTYIYNNHEKFANYLDL